MAPWKILKFRVLEIPFPRTLKVIMGRGALCTACKLFFWIKSFIMIFWAPSLGAETGVLTPLNMALQA